MGVANREDRFFVTLDMLPKVLIRIPPISITNSYGIPLVFFDVVG